MTFADLEAIGIPVDLVEEIPAGVIVFAIPGREPVVLDLRPRPGQFVEAAPFSGEAPDWPLRSPGLPFDWERDLHVPDFGVRRV